MGRNDTTAGPAWVCHGCGADLGCCSYLIRDGYYLCARCVAARVTPFVADDHAYCRAALAAATARAEAAERERDEARVVARRVVEVERHNELLRADVDALTRTCNARCDERDAARRDLAHLLDVAARALLDSWEDWEGACACGACPACRLRAVVAAVVARLGGGA